MYDDFLRLCGFEPEEIKKEERRIERAFSIFEIDSEDINKAQERVTAYYDVELTAIRKILGLWLKEFSDLVLAKEEGKKTVYASMPPNRPFMAAMSASSQDVYCIVPEAVIDTVMGSIFGKVTPLLEAAESSGMPPGNAFCSYLQTRLAAIATGKIPMPDLAIPSCLGCDQSPKVDELLHEIYGVPVIYMDHVFEDKGEDWPRRLDLRRIRYLARGMEDGAKQFEHLFDYKIRESSTRELLAQEAELNRDCVNLFEVMNADPAPASRNDLKIAQGLSTICSRRCAKEAPPLLKQLRRELEERVRSGQGRIEKGAPHIMFTYPPYNPELIDMIEKMGLAISISSLSSPVLGKPAEMKYDSMWEEIAQTTLGRGAQLYSSIATINLNTALVKTHDLDGIILFHHIGCRWPNNALPGTRDRIEKDLGIPVLILEGDCLDARHYGHQQARNRLEAFSEVVKSTAAKRKGRSRDIRRH